MQNKNSKTQFIMYSQLKQKTTLIGFIGADAEIKTLQENQHLVVFPFGVNDDYKNKNGEFVKRTIWFTVQQWFNTKEPNFYTSFKKGLPFILEGKLKSRPFIREDKEDNPLPVEQRLGVEMILLLHNFEKLPYNKSNNNEISTSVMQPGNFTTS